MQDGLDTNDYNALFSNDYIMIELSNSHFIIMFEIRFTIGHRIYGF